MQNVVLKNQNSKQIKFDIPVYKLFIYVAQGFDTKLYLKDFIKGI